MRLLKRLFAALRAQRPGRPAGYGEEVLFAGWVELPAAFRELQCRPVVPPNRTIPA